jgi:hypothetical protein
MDQLFVGLLEHSMRGVPIVNALEHERQRAHVVMTEALVDVQGMLDVE